jgi:hypothetical protein
MWNTVPHYKASVDRKNVKYPFHTGQGSILFITGYLRFELQRQRNMQYYTQTKILQDVAEKVKHFKILVTLC